uniref:Wsv035-like protein n=1 Tax=Metapenaeus joyneri majanivirus TaxID=2984280 RepID=A0A9C7EYV7_9VIRU|nr:MAG: wsv035-like protein [Metapenaeus joyneri majanivirus]
MKKQTNNNNNNNNNNNSSSNSNSIINSQITLKKRKIGQNAYPYTFIVLFILITFICITAWILFSNLAIQLNDASNLKNLYFDFTNLLGEGITPQHVFDTFIKNEKDVASTHVLDINSLPQQHLDLAFESKHGNPLFIQSQENTIRKQSKIKNISYHASRYTHTGKEFKPLKGDTTTTTTTNNNKNNGNDNRPIEYQPTQTHSSFVPCSVDTVKRYVSALLGYPKSNNDIITDNNNNLKNNKNERIMMMMPNKRIPFYKNPTVVHHGGACTNPIPLEGVTNCSDLCMNPECRTIEGPFISGDKVYPAGKLYCWCGPPSALEDMSLNGIHRHDNRLLCSDTTAVLILQENGKWTCSPQYPFLFGGRSGTERKACLYDPYLHDPPPDELGGDNDPYEIFNLSNPLIDSVTGQTITSHYQLANSAYFTKMITAGSSLEFLSIANDKEFYRNNFIGCQCSTTALDIFGNPPLTVSQSSNFLFFGLSKCNVNPCVMTRVADGFVRFDETDNTCHAVAQEEDQVYHAIHGDERTPLVGTLTPAAGIIPASSLALTTTSSFSSTTSSPSSSPPPPSSPSATIAAQNIKLSIGPNEASPDNPSESLAIKITRLSSPVIPASNNDSSNKTRNVLFLPIQSISMTGRKPKNTIRIPEIYFTDASCTPPISIGALRRASPIPFNVATYFIEPIPNILMNNIPEKPYEHELFVLEGLRNSRLVSGNVLGGSEMLFSLLLANNKNGNNNKNDISQLFSNPGYQRLEATRYFYNTIFKHRRLSTFERYQQNLFSNRDTSTMIENNNKNTSNNNNNINNNNNNTTTTYSSWDIKFRRGEVENFSGIENLNDTFVIREGLLLRSYRAYAGWALMASSNMTVDFSDVYHQNLSRNNHTPRATKIYNNRINSAQLMFPTSHSLLPLPNSNNDIFSIDRTLLFDHETFSRYLTRDSNTELKIFRKESPEYSVSPYVVNSDYGWGVNSFRYLYNFKENIYNKYDKRIKFDESNFTFTGKFLPASIFKKSLIEWGHKHGDVEYGNWLLPTLDTTPQYRDLIKRTNSVYKPMWWTAVWPRTFWRYSNDYFHIDDE